MNMDVNSTQDYSDKFAIEIAELQEEIILPELPDKEFEPLTLETLRKFEKEGREYKLMEREYENMIGNFYISIMFPLVENGDSTELEFEAPPTNNILNGSLATKPYVERNFISLAIPKYIVMNFEKKIPKGTKFLIGFVGGSRSIENISIIGLYGHELPL